MTPDIVDIRAFYSTPLGDVARRLVGRVLRARWESCVGLTVLGLGYAPPYLERFRDESMRVMAAMPAEQGVVNWPAEGASRAVLVETDALPFPDGSIDRLLIVHALETAERPRDLLAEAWRALTPGGRMIVVAPARGGLWSRSERTPFGSGQPYSRKQIYDLMRETLFSPIFSGEALYGAPSQGGFALRTATAFERFGARFSLPGAGVLVVEATKQLYRPVGFARRRLPRFAPAAALAAPRAK
ncbi:MAG: methyltransferase domain-containing protein [Hyphomicrobiales bacterium]|nr:methyltransferase domain-containing protein [Hyphomicrobiales bacterium]MDE2018710.1 methyltransferase domain-containing protein [Hyphomicrobiales bacterium]